METTSQPVEQRRVRRRVFLVDRKFQLKYTGILVLVGVVVSAILGYFVIRLSREATQLLNMDPDLMAEAAKFDTVALYYLGGFIVVMAVFLFMWGIWITHQVAGPIFIISRYLRQIADGSIPKTRPLRRGDQLQEFFETFGAMLNSIKQRNLEEAEALSKAAALMGDKGPELAEQAKKLSELAARKKAWGEAPTP